MLLRKKKFNKKVYNAYVTTLIVLKNINSFNSKKKDEILLRLNAISIKIKKSKTLIILKFSTLILIVCFKKKINEI